MKLATYMEDTEDVFIWFEFSHDYVRKPKFELEIWGDKLEEVFLIICLLDLIFPKNNFEFNI